MKFSFYAQLLSIAFFLPQPAFAQLDLNEAKSYERPIVRVSFSPEIPSFGGSPVGETNNPSLLEDGPGNVVIVPQTGKRVQAYSLTTGRWASIDLEEGDVSDVFPTTDGKVVVFRVKRWVYGFSAKAGRWDKIQISNELLATDDGGSKRIAVPMLGNGTVAIKSGRVICAFCAEHAKWDRLVISKYQTAQVKLHKNMISVSDEMNIYDAFSDTSQEWSGVDLMTGEQLPVNRELPQ
ncbi:hypothetical protein [Lacunimicrobium album]